MKMSRLPGAVSVCVLTLYASSSHSALISVLGGEAYYDDILDITWAQDANINGRDTWTNQTAWAAGLTIGGVTGWRLPSIDVNGDLTEVDCATSTELACRDSEYGHLWYYGADTVSGGITPGSPGPFSNMVSNAYWSSTELNGSTAWYFSTNSGATTTNGKAGNFYAWAVYDGNAALAAVPVPAAAWLFGSGLLGLVGMARRKKVA